MYLSLLPDHCAHKLTGSKSAELSCVRMKRRLWVSGVIGSSSNPTTGGFAFGHSTTSARRSFFECSASSYRARPAPRSRCQVGRARQESPGRLVCPPASRIYLWAQQFPNTTRVPPVPRRPDAKRSPWIGIHAARCAASEARPVRAPSRPAVLATCCAVGVAEFECSREEEVGAARCRSSYGRRS